MARLLNIAVETNCPVSVENHSSLAIRRTPYTYSRPYGCVDWLKTVFFSIELGIASEEYRTPQARNPKHQVAATLPHASALACCRLIGDATISYPERPTNKLDHEIVGSKKWFHTCRRTLVPNKRLVLAFCAPRRQRQLARRGQRYHLEELHPRCWRCRASLHLVGWPCRVLRVRRDPKTPSPGYWRCPSSRFRSAVNGSPLAAWSRIPSRFQECAVDNMDKRLALVHPRFGPGEDWCVSLSTPTASHQRHVTATYASTSSISPFPCLCNLRRV